MTCIAGISHKGKVWMGGDSATICGDRLQCDTLPKVYRNGEYIFGAAGDARIADLLHYAFRPPAPPGKSRLDEFMATKFVLSLQKCFEKYAYPSDSEEGETFSGNILVGVKGNLYSLDANFALGRIVDGFDAIGAGAEIALGAFYASFNRKPIDRLHIALNAAAAFCQNVRPPFVVESV